jgi:hypothetical protein
VDDKHNKDAFILYPEIDGVGKRAKKRSPMIENGGKTFWSLLDRPDRGV